MRQTSRYYSTETLGAEHQPVLQALDKLENYSKSWGTGNAPADAAAKAALEEVVAFFDKELEPHLQKEEIALFPAVEAVIGKDGPTFVMLMEHEDLRKSITTLKALVPTLGGKDDAKAAQLKKTGNYIYRLLTGHIEKEDTVLFPMADQVVPPSEMAKVDEKARELDALKG